jgi:hypothetical protein
MADKFYRLSAHLGKRYNHAEGISFQMEAMSETKSYKSPAIYAILAWMVINAIFFLLEFTVFNDAADLNNSILLILWISSIVGLSLMRKIGAALTTFTLIYAFSFNAFNVIYYPQVFLLNGTSALINGIAIIYMFKSIFANSFR